MSHRIMGIETEFGCMIQSQAMQTQRIKVSPEGVAANVRDYTFKILELGIPDLHYRDWGEPPGNGGFLFNGGRLYIDMGHLEYATPECANLFDLIAYDKAIEHEKCRRAQLEKRTKFQRSGKSLKKADHASLKFREKGLLLFGRRIVGFKSLFEKNCG